MGVPSIDYIGPGGAVTPGGHYRLSVKTGLTTGLSAADPILLWRWTDAAHLLVLHRVKVNAVITTAFGTAQRTDVSMFANRSWSTAPSGGTTVPPFKPSENLVRDMGGGMSPLQQFLPGLQVATTGALTTGTRTQDTNPMAGAVFNVSALASADERTLYELTPGIDYPAVFGATEGIEIVVVTAQGATGVVQFVFSLVFSVVPQF